MNRSFHKCITIFAEIYIIIILGKLYIPWSIICTSLRIYIKCLYNIWLYTMIHDDEAQIHCP